VEWEAGDVKRSRAAGVEQGRRAGRKAAGRLTARWTGGSRQTGRGAGARQVVGTERVTVAGSQRRRRRGGGGGGGGGAPPPPPQESYIYISYWGIHV
jgi:hypothetical protein